MPGQSSRADLQLHLFAALLLVEEHPVAGKQLGDGGVVPAVVLLAPVIDQIPRL